MRMGHEMTNGGRGTRAIFGICATALLLLALVPSALAGPFHARKPALDVEGLNHACGTAVDSKGDLYASSAGESKINVYDPSHNLLTSIPDSHEPCGLAVNSRGQLVVSEKATGEVVVFGPNAYPFVGTPTYSPRHVIDSSGEAKGISIDRFDDRLYVAEGTRVSSYLSEVQSLNVTNANGGTYKLRFKGEETASLPFNASGAEVKAALEALAAIGAGGVSVSSNQVAFSGSLAYTDVPPIEAVRSLTGNETQTVTVKATTGTYKLRFEGEETAPIPYNAPASGAGSVREALEGLAAIAPGDVSVTGGPGDSEGTKPYFVTFEGAYAAKNVDQMGSEAAALSGGTASVGTGSGKTQRVTVKASAGTYKLTPTTAAGSGNTSSGSKGVSGVTASLGAFRVGDAISGTGIPSGATITAVGAGTLTLSAAATATNSAVSLSATETTAAILYNASAAEVQAALMALAGIGAGNVAVSGGPGGDSASTKPYLVSFEGAFAGKIVPSMKSDAAALSGTAEVASLTDGASISTSNGSGGLGTNEAQQINLTNVRGGTYTLKFENEETAAIAYNAPARKGEGAGSVEAALEALDKIAPGDVSVLSSAGTIAFRTYTVGFEGAYAATDVAQIEMLPSLVGNETQRVTVKATAGTYTLKFEEEETGPIPFEAPATGAGSVQEALEELPNTASGDVSVTGGPGDEKGTKPYLVTFEGNYANTNVGTLGRNLSGLTGTATVATLIQGLGAAVSTPTASWSGRIGEGTLTEATGVAAYTYRTRRLR